MFRHYAGKARSCSGIMTDGLVRFRRCAGMLYHVQAMGRKVILCYGNVTKYQDIFQQCDGRL